ncbi:MAG: GNAT family N-acetyltransferase [Actinomycetota bacterium]|nr:GNAT family N-acetyltransferase [Actinomycetota bacterium]
MAESAITIVRAGLERVDDLEPLWGALQVHHAELAPTLKGARARSAEEAWTLRRRKYLTALAEPDAFVIIAEQAARAVGYAVVTVGEGPSGWDLGERVAEVETLAVLPEARGRGVGTRLMDAVEAELPRLGIAMFGVLVIAANEEAMRFYEERGLTPVSRVLIGRVGCR